MWLWCQKQKHGPQTRGAGGTCGGPKEWLSQSVQAAVTEHHRLGVYEQQAFISHSSGGWTSKIKSRADLVSGEAGFLVRGWQPFHCVPTEVMEGARGH